MYANVYVYYIHIYIYVYAWEGRGTEGEEGRRGGEERERKRKLIIFRDNGSDIMIYNIEKFIRIGAFSWPTAIFHCRIKKKENIVNKRKSKRTSQDLIKCYNAHRYGYVRDMDMWRREEREKGKGYEHTGDLSFCAPFKTDTGYAEGSRALMFFFFFPYIRILHKYVIFYTCSACDGMLISVIDLCVSIFCSIFSQFNSWRISRYISLLVKVYR